MRLFLTTLGLLSVAALCAFTSFRASAVEAGTARKMDITDMVDASDLAFQGMVISKSAGLGDHNLIETEYVFAVENTFWGEALSTRVIKLPGGVLPDGRGLVLSGMPSLNEREEVLIFLSASSSGGLRMPIGLAQGKFTVVHAKNGVASLVRDSQALQLADPATGKLEEAPARSVHNYAQVTAEILAAVTARKARIAAGEEQGK